MPNDDNKGNGRKPDKTIIPTQITTSKVVLDVNDVIAIYKKYIDFFLYPFLFPKEFAEKAKTNPELYTELKNLNQSFYNHFVEQAHKQNIANGRVVLNNRSEPVFSSFKYKKEYQQKYLDQPIKKLTKNYVLALKYFKTFGKPGNTDMLENFLIDNAEIFNFFNENKDSLLKLAKNLTSSLKIEDEQLVKIKTEVDKDFQKKKNDAEFFNILNSKSERGLFLPSLNLDQSSKEKNSSQKNQQSKNSVEIKSTSYDKYLSKVIKNQDQQESVLDIIINDQNLRLIVDNLVNWLDENPNASSYLKKDVNNFLSEIFNECLNEETYSKNIAIKFEKREMKAKLKQMYPGNDELQSNIKEAVQTLKQTKAPVPTR